VFGGIFARAAGDVQLLPGSSGAPRGPSLPSRRSAVGGRRC